MREGLGRKGTDMKAIIIEDKDVHALLDSLKLEAMKGAGHFRQDNQSPTVDEMHRAFHDIVVRWLAFEGDTAQLVSSSQMATIVANMRGASVVR